MSRIVVLTSGPLCRNPRVLKEATALGNAGHQVTVLTAAYNHEEETKDATILLNAPFNKQVVDLIPGTGLVRRFRCLTRRGSGMIARRLLSTGLFSAHALGPATALGRRARALPWDLLIAHTELPMLIASRLLREGRRVAADIEDWHSRDLLPSDRIHRPIKLLRETEHILLNHARVTMTTSEAMADGLHAAYGGARPVVVRNVFPLQPMPGRPHSEAPPSFFWFSQTIGPGRGVEEFITAWNRTQMPSRLALLGNISPGYRATLISLVTPARRGFLSFLPVVSPDALPSLIAEHHIGLALEHIEPDNHNLTISNKIFQYFNAGLGVLATATAGQREAAGRAPGACVFVDLSNPQELSTGIDALLAAPERLAALGAAARAAATAELCWEREAPRLVAAIEAALPRSTRTTSQ